MCSTENPEDDKTKVEEVGDDGRPHEPEEVKDLTDDCRSLISTKKIYNLRPEMHILMKGTWERATRSAMKECLFYNKIRALKASLRNRKKLDPT